MNTIPFTLPLNCEQFASALQKGQGRALMHIRAFGLAEFEAAIVDACVHNRTYDPQCEGERIDWLMEIVDASGTEAKIAQALTTQLDPLTDQFWDATQRCRIVRELAIRGHPEARSRLYASLRKWPDTGDVIGAEDIIAIDGADGLLHVAEYLGTLLQNEPGFWADEMPLTWYDETKGEGSARRVLDAAGAHSPLVAGYLRHLDERERAKPRASNDTMQSGAYLSLENIQFDLSAPKSHRERMQRIAAADVVHEIETEDPQKNRFWFTSWGLHASENGLSAVFESMISQSEPSRLCKYLRVFARRALPAFDPRLLQYADHDNPEVRGLAHRALSNYSHPEVRRLAIERLRAGRFIEDELQLLKKNYQLGDSTLIEQAVQFPDDRNQLHGLLYELVELFQSNQVAESAKILRFVYEESPCSNCRCKAVKILVAMGSAPDWILEECRHDSSEEIRAIVAAREPLP